MGGCQSKNQKSKHQINLSLRGSRSVDDIMMVSDNEGGSISEKTYDEGEVNKLYKELMDRPQIFVLNNLLMSIMFFENYEREKQRTLISSRTTMEKELNSTLLRDETIECVIPDVIFESVNKNVLFRHVHGPNKNKYEPLVPKRLYVVNDNIEVLESQHTPHYSAIDKPRYQVVLENSDHSGFVKLKYSPSQGNQIYGQKVYSEVSEEPKPGPSSRPDDPEDIYDYTTVTHANTPQYLHITSCERRDTLPKSCFAVRKVKKLDDLPDCSDEEEEEEKPQEKEELYENISYISSKGFMKHFQNGVFPSSLGIALGFDITEISTAKAIYGKIFSNLQDVDAELPPLPCEIIPSVAIQWPIDLTFEFHQRGERPTMWDRFGMEYRWPLDWMVNDIRGLTCVLIPKGFIPKRGENTDCDIEWEVGFPKAERYLDTHMIHSQVRAFLFLLSIFKAYIEPVTKQYGVRADHIRTHMYWEIESNPRDWPEHRLGTRLVSVINNFIKTLSTGKLSDFFIKKKNAFENIPNKHLKHAQKIFHDVLESPAIYFIGALRNLKYTNAKFYPQLNLKRLYKIITSPNSLELVNSEIFTSMPPNMHPKIRREQVGGDANYRKEIKWKVKKERQNRERKLKELQEKKMREENLKIERKGSVDSINFEWQAEKQFDNFKNRALLVFFIEHFIEMAKKSRRLATQRQARFYLKQAYYLAKIMEKIGLEADARDFIEKISIEEDESIKQSVTESFELPPSTPKRNSAQFNWELTQQVKNNNINLNKLNQSYNQSMVTPPTFTKIKKHPSNLKRRSSALRNNFPEERRKSLETAGRRSVVGFSDTVEVR